MNREMKISQISWCPYHPRIRPVCLQDSGTERSSEPSRFVFCQLPAEKCAFNKPDRIKSWHCHCMFGPRTSFECFSHCMIVNIGVLLWAWPVRWTYQLYVVDHAHDQFFKWPPSVVIWRTGLDGVKEVYTYSKRMYKKVKAFWIFFVIFFLLFPFNLLFWFC